MPYIVKFPRVQKAISVIAAFTLGVLCADAAASALVEKLQMPAWLERGGTRTALAAGTELRGGDRLITGGQGRLLVVLGDGSILRVGEQTDVVIPELAGSAVEGVLRARLTLTGGALRFTAGASPLQVRGDIALRLGDTNLEVQSADLYAHSIGQVDTVCHIQGTLAVQHAAGTRFTMDQPGTVFRVSGAAGPTPIAPADPQMLNAWLQTTELLAGAGTTVVGGGWVVQLGSFREQSAAGALAARLRRAGYATEVTSTETVQPPSHRVRIAQFDSAAEAKGFVDRVKARLNISQFWVTCPRAGCPAR